MYRLAFIAVESGACVANPVYETRQDCVDMQNRVVESDIQDSYVYLETDVDGKEYLIPTKATYVIVIEEVIEEEY